jgi:hypothetical protein
MSVFASFTLRSARTFVTAAISSKRRPNNGGASFKDQLMQVVSVTATSGTTSPVETRTTQVAVMRMRPDNCDIVRPSRLWTQWYRSSKAVNWRAKRQYKYL